VNNQQKILIVDDKDQNLFALERVLQNVDAQIIRATCGNDALIACLNHEFALAILDVKMPVMDGYELAEVLRADEKTRNLPIIFLTAVYSDEYHVFKGYEAGAVD
jgi:CheY-like chemotaxis protein